MYELFEKHLRDNRISYTCYEGFIFEIGGLIYQYHEPVDGILFNKDMKFIHHTDCDRHAFSFGGRFYWLDSGGEFQLNEFKYIGESDQQLPTTSFLGVRGYFELMNGTGDYDTWVKKAKFLGIKNLGICEKHTLAGALKFQKACKAEEIKSVIGETVTVQNKGGRYELKLYVKDEIGYTNLLLINYAISESKTKAIDEFELVKKLQGLNVVVHPKKAKLELISEVRKVSEAIFYQLDTVEYTVAKEDNSYLIELLKYYKSGIEPVSITDAFYVDKDLAYIKHEMNLITSVFDVMSENQYLKPKDEYFEELNKMFDPEDEKIFDIFQRAVDNETKIADECNFEIDTSTRHMPEYTMTPEEAKLFDSNEDLFWSKVESGLMEKVPQDEWDGCMERIQREYGTLKLGNVVDYFLSTADILNANTSNGILNGFGRGSSAGSLIAYLLDIVKINPLKHNLLFERFLTPDRLGKMIDDDVMVLTMDDGSKKKLFHDERLIVTREGKKIVTKASELQKNDELT